MTDKAKLLESVKKNVRALLISAPMGLSMRELERDYTEVIGDRIAQVALQLGYNSAQDLILNMPDVASTRWDRGLLVLFGVANNKDTERIQKLVARQRKDKAKIQKKREKINRRPAYRDSLDSYSSGPSSYSSRSSTYSSRPSTYSSNPPRRSQQTSFPAKPYRPPPLRAPVPASVQNQVKLILKKHPAGISSSEFQIVFHRYQNFHLNYKNLGYESLWEFLHAIPDVKASHTSKDEFDIYLVSGDVGAIPAGYEDIVDAEPSDFIHKGKVSRSIRIERSSTEREPERPKRSLPPRLSEPRMAPSNSRTPWALGGVPQPHKKVATARGRGRVREEPSEDTSRVTEAVSGASGRKPWSSRPRERADDAPLPIEQDVDAPFEKEFVDSIRQILSKHPDGIWSIELPDEYEQLTGKPFRVFAMGYFSVVELVSAMPDVVTVVREDTSDWKLYDARRTRSDSPLSQEAQGRVVQTDEANLDLVKGRLRMLLEEFDEGILLDDLESAYENKYSRVLPLQQLGFQDIDSLILLIPDAIKVVYQGHGKVYAFAQRETLGIPKYDSKMAMLCSLPQDAVGFGYKFHDHEMPPLNEYFEVYVSSVYTPHKFTIQVRDKEKNLALEELMDDLESIYKFPEGERYFFPVSMIAVNQLCCALYLEDNNWHRGVITGVIDNDLVEVNYVDYGSTLQVPKSCIRLLKACFLKVPAMAIDAKLANIEPREGKWSSKARDRLLELTTEKPLIAYCTEIRNKVLSLFLCDTTTDQDIHINDVMVQDEYAVFSNQKAPTVNIAQGAAATFDPSDFINPIAELPPDVLVPVPLEVQVPGDQETQDYPDQQYSPVDVPPHQVPEAGDHIVERQESVDVEEEYIEDEIAEMAQELEGIESESDSEDLEEIEENNLNIEDIELTMKFLEGRRKRLLAVLSSEDGVNAIDDLDETEALIRHFEERKKKIALARSTERKASSSKSVEVQPEEQPEERSRSPLEEDQPSQEDNQPREQPATTTLNDLKQELLMAATHQSPGKEEGGLLRGGVLSVDGRVQDEPELPSTEGVSHIPEGVSHVPEGIRREEEVAGESRTDFPILESENTESRQREPPPARPVVDPATLKDLGEMLRSSLKISAEPFKPKATISPFRRPGAQLPMPASAYLDNRDTQKGGKGASQEHMEGQGSYQQEMEGPPSSQVMYEQMMQQYKVDPRMYQQQVPGFPQAQEQFLTGQYQMPGQGGYLPGVGRGHPFPHPSAVEGPGQAYGSAGTGGPHIPQVQRNLGHGSLSMMGYQPGFDPISQIDSERLNASQAGYQMPGGSRGMPPQMVQAGQAVRPPQQNERRQDVQQFYTGGLDIHRPQPIPAVRNPSAPSVRGMRVSAPQMRFPNPMPGANFQRPPSSFQRPPQGFQRPPPNLNAGNMPFPPPSSMGNVENTSMGGVNSSMYGAPPMGYNMGNRMISPGVMGRGRGASS